MDWKHKYHQQIMRPWEPGSKTDYDQKKSEIHKQIEVSFHPSKGKALKESQLPLPNSHGSFFFVSNSTLTTFISLCLYFVFFFKTPDMWQSHISISCLCPEAAQIYIKNAKRFSTSNCGIQGCKKKYLTLR